MLTIINLSIYDNLAYFAQILIGISHFYYLNTDIGQSTLIQWKKDVITSLVSLTIIFSTNTKILLQKQI